MTNNNIVTAIDVGTNKVCTIVAERLNESFKILGYSTVPSLGIQKGSIIDIDLVSSAISQSVNEVETELDINIESAYVGITGPNITFETKRDRMDSVAKNGVITNQDLNRNTNDLKTNLGFYSFLLVSIVLIIAGLRILYFIQDIVVQKFPSSKIYIDYLFESLRNIKDIIQSFFSNY